MATLLQLKPSTMKTLRHFFLVAICFATIISCSDDDEKPRKGDPDISHVGTRWRIASIKDYSITEVSMTNVFTKTGDAANAGYFYFQESENLGSFELTLDGYNKEDFFSFTKDENGEISIVTVDVSAGVPTNQNVVVIAGEQTSDTQITLSTVSIVKNSTQTGVFTLTATSIELVKE